MKKTKKTTNEKIQEISHKIIAVLDEVDPETKKPLRVDVSQIEELKDLQEDRHKIFVFFYTLAGTKSYRNGAESYRKAGYKPKNAQIAAINATNLRKKFPEINEAIEKIDQRLIETNVEDTYKIIMEQKRAAATFDRSAYFNSQEIVDDNGNKTIVRTIVDPNELTPLQRSVIKNIKYNQRGIPEYEFEEKKDNQKFFIDLYEKKHGQSDSNDMDVELTLEGIKSEVKAKLVIAKKNNERVDASGKIDNAEEFEEEL